MQESFSWNVYGAEFASMDLPVNWVAWNPLSMLLAVVSGPKTPSMPAPPVTDLVSPTLPKTHRITVYNLRALLPSSDLHSTSTILSFSPPEVMRMVDFVPNGEVLLSWCSPTVVSGGLLSACIIDANREHKVILFDKDDLSLEKASVFNLPGGSVTYFSATPRGEALVLLKGSSLSVFHPEWNVSLSRPELVLACSTEIADSSCSPFHWLNNKEKHTIEFLTSTSRGALLHLRIAGDTLNCAETVNSIPSSVGGSFYHLIWDDANNKEDEPGQLVRVGMFGLDTERLARDGHAPMEGNIVSTTSNSLHSLTCCGISFDSSGKYLAIGDWSSSLSVWDVGAGSTRTHIPSALLTVEHSMIRAVEWNRHPYKDGRMTIICGDTSGHLQECTLYNRNSTGILTLGSIRKISSTKRTITCVQWSSNAHPNLFLASHPSIQDQWLCFLATGDSDGQLRIYGRSAKDDSISQLVKFQAHLQMPHVTSHDIWTLSFSPCGRFIATGSEDYTVHLYKFDVFGNNKDGLQLLATLHGPDAAVTCIDWQITPLGTLLVVASDDRTIHVWKQDDTDGTLTLLRVLRTNWEHLMITYVCMESNGTRIACTTMSGYIYVFDLGKADYRERCKAHLGSIEGLAWNRHRPDCSQLAVCSSDCTSTLFRLK